MISSLIALNTVFSSLGGLWICSFCRMMGRALRVFPVAAGGRCEGAVDLRQETITCCNVDLWGGCFFCTYKLDVHWMG